MRSLRTLVVCAVVAAPIALGAASTPAGASVGGSVKGVIKNAATGKPIAGVCVNVIEASDNTSVGTSGPSSSTGTWKLAHIEASSDYTAVSVNCSGSNYVGQWYRKQDFQNTATQFSVNGGSTTTGINFSLKEGGNVSGTVTDSTTGDPVQDVLVVALWTTSNSASTYSTCTSASGTYKLKAVPTSGAIIWFDTSADAGACGASTSYDQEYYLNSVSYGSANVVPVQADKTTKHIDQTLAPAVSG
jgi:hypothetical protein